MNNFLTFIDEDIEAKKTLISTLPVRTKRNKAAFNEKIDSFTLKYNGYLKHIKKYIETKSKSFEIKEDKSKLESLTNVVTTLEYIKFINNPTNTYYEKMGFDNLIYRISNYYNFSFDFLNDIIKEFLSKFELAGITLKSSEFDYTCYVNEYMTAYLKVTNDDYQKVSEIFERIYWLNPEIIEHLELNFRKLIKKYSKKFDLYVSKIAKEALATNNINNYEECITKLKKAFKELNKASGEDITDIIELAKEENIDINQFFEDSKVRTETYHAIMADSLDLSNTKKVEEFYEDLGNLKRNVEEYKYFISFVPLIEDFKKEYEKMPISKLKEAEKIIKDKESKLNKLNKKIIGKTFKDDNKAKILKVQSVELAKELYELYRTYDAEYFKDKVTEILNESLTMSELLNLYFSYDYFKKIELKRIFNLETYEDVTKYSDDFDLFAMNPTNVIAEGVLVFSENDIPKNIVNKYRLNSINVNEEDLDESALDELLNKLNLLLRIYEVEKSDISIEKIWFMVQVERFKKAKEKSNLL